MKKTIICLAIFAIFAAPTAIAQEFNVGTNVINAGIGLGGYYYGYSTSSQSPMLNISYERGIWETAGPGVISLGGYFGRKTFKYNSTFANYKWSYNIIGVRGAYHYNGLDIENLDVYGGAMVSYNIYSGTGGNNYRSRPNATAFVGGRWFFTDNIAAFVEAGYGVAYLTLGASFSF